jgi:hypothetical protein
MHATRVTVVPHCACGRDLSRRLRGDSEPALPSRCTNPPAFGRGTTIRSDRRAPADVACGAARETTPFAARRTDHSRITKMARPRAAGRAPARPSQTIVTTDPSVGTLSTAARSATRADGSGLAGGCACSATGRAVTTSTGLRAIRNRRASVVRARGALNRATSDTWSRGERATPPSRSKSWRWQ